MAHKSKPERGAQQYVEQVSYIDLNETLSSPEVTLDTELEVDGQGELEDYSGPAAEFLPVVMSSDLDAAALEEGDTNRYWRLAPIFDVVSTLDPETGAWGKIKVVLNSDFRDEIRRAVKTGAAIRAEQ